MYQLEIKATLVRSRFHPENGWSVTVDIDPMERCHGGTHPADKRARVATAEETLRSLGVSIGRHDFYGRADVFATHATEGTVVVEVEGQSSRQREQAMYAALGQTILAMRSNDPRVSYALAVPDEAAWERQLSKVPPTVVKLLRLQFFLVSPDGTRDFQLLA